MSFFGKNIRKLRKLKSYSQQEIADILGLKRGALGAYEEGRSEPKINTIISAANYFSIPIDQLLTKELTVNEILNFNTQLTIDERLHRKPFPKIPLINANNLKDYLKYHNKQDYIENMVFIQLPLEPNKEYRSFEIIDLEMSYKDQGLFPKDMVVGERLDPKDLQFEKLCIVVASNVWVRHVSKVKDDFLLKANHPAIEDMNLQSTDVFEIWEVMASFQRHRTMG